MRLNICVLFLVGLVSCENYYFKSITETKPEDSSYSFEGTGVALDSKNATYIVGYTDATLFGMNDGYTTDIFIAKYIPVINSDSLYRVWGTQIDSANADRAHRVVLNPDETKLFLCGTYVFDPTLMEFNASSGALLRQYSYSTPHSYYLEAFRDAVVIGSSIYAAGYYYPNDTNRYDALVVKLDNATLTPLWTRTMTAGPGAYDDLLYAITFLASSSRLFAAGETTRSSVGKEFYLVELNYLTGAVIYERVWPGTTCTGNRDQSIFDIQVDNTGLYFAGSSTQEFKTDGTTSYCSTLNQNALVLGKLSLSNLNNTVWIQNVSVIQSNFSVEGSAMVLSNGLLYIAGKTSAASLFGKNNTTPGGKKYDAFYYIINAATQAFVDFEMKGNPNVTVDDTATDIAAQGSEGTISLLWFQILENGTNITVLAGKNSPDPSPTPSPSTTPSRSPSSSPTATMTPTSSVSPSSSPSKTPSSSSTMTPFPASSKSKDNTTSIAAGASAGAVAIVAISAVLIVFIRRKKMPQPAASNTEVPLNNIEKGPRSGSSNYWSTTNSDKGYATMASPSEKETDYGPLKSVHASLNMELHSNFLEIKYSELTFGSKLGQGAYGVVYKGKWRGGDVAIKQVHEGVSQEKIDDFFKEAALMQKIRPHSNVVQFLGICTHPLVIVTEFLERGSLHSFLRTEEGKNLSKEKEVELMRGIASGMYHLASEGLVHRDLAARNILLTGTLVPKISDFGMSRLVAQESGNVTQSSVGPLKWMAPENVFDRTYSEKSDVWSYGVLCIEIVTKADPYLGMEGVQVAFGVGSMKLKPAIPSHSPEVERMLKACFGWQPVERPDFKTIFEELLK